MPLQVPRYDRQVEPAALPGVRTAPDAQMPGVEGPMQATKQALGTLQGMAQQEKQRADDTATQQAYELAVRTRNKMVYDPKGGLLTRRGQNAFSAPDEFLPAYDKQLDDIEGMLANDTQRAMFAKIRTQQRGELDATVKRHVAEEARAHEAEVFKSTMSTTVDDMVLNHGDRDSFARNTQLLKGLLVDRAAKEGQDSTWVKDNVNKAMSQVHRNVIHRMLVNGNDQGARAWWGQNQDVVKDKEDRTWIESALHEGTTQGDGMRLADRMLDSYSDEYVALDEVKKEFEAGRITEETRKVAEGRVRQGFGDRARFSARAYADQLNNAWNEVENQNRRPNAAVWTGLKHQDRREIDSYLTKRAKGEPIDTNWAIYYGLKRMAMDPTTRAGFVNENLWGYRTKLSDTEFKELVNMQVGLSQKDERTEKQLDGFRSDQQIVNDSLNAAGIDPTPKQGSGDAEKVANFRRRVDEQVQQLQERLGRKARNEEVQSIVDDLMIKVRTDEGVLWDTKKRSFELTIKDVPGSERAKIEDALRRAGRPISDQTITDVYVRKLQRDSRAQ